MKNINRSIFLFLFILVSFSGFAQNPMKGAGISYFDTPPNTWANPNEQFSSEMGFNVITKTFYYWDRTQSTWIPFRPNDDVTAFYINNDKLCLFENQEYCIPLDDINGGTTVNSGNGTPIGTGNETEGDTYIDSSTGIYYVFDGDNWIEVGSSNASSIISIENPDGSITHTHDDGEGNTSVFTTNDGSISSITSITNPDGSITHTHDDGEGNTSVFTTNDGSTSSITSITNPDGSITHTHDNGEGNTSVFTTNDGSTSSITSITNPDGSITHTHDDGEGNISVFTTNDGSTSSITSITNPDGSITYTHDDGDGNTSVFTTNDGNSPMVSSVTDANGNTIYTYTDTDPTTDDISWEIISHLGDLTVSGYSVDSTQVILTHENSDGSSQNVSIDFPCKDIAFTDFLGNKSVFNDCEGILLDRDLMIQDLSSEGSVNQSITTPFADVVQFGNSLVDVTTYSNVLALATSSADNSGNYSIVSGFNPENTADANFTTGSNCSSSAKNAITFGARTTNSGINSIAGGIGSTINTGSSSIVVGLSLNNSGSNSVLGGSRNIASGGSIIGGGSDNNCTGGNSAFFGSNNTVTSSSSIGSGNNRINNGPASFSGGTSSGTMMSIPATWSTAPNSISYGLNTQTIGANSVALGSGTKASAMNQIVLGQYNASTGVQDLDELDPSDHIFVIGNGAGFDERRNALAVRKDGIIQQYIFAGITLSSVPSTIIAIDVLNTATISDPNLFTGAIAVVEVINRTLKPGAGPEEFIYNASQNTWELR